jgi:hypothetical protein
MVMSAPTVLNSRPLQRVPTVGALPSWCCSTACDIVRLRRVSGSRHAKALGCSGARCDGGCSAGQCCGSGRQRCLCRALSEGCRCAERGIFVLRCPQIDDGNDFRVHDREQLQLAGSIASVQLFCEVAVLFLCVVAFAVVGVLSARRVSARLLDIETVSAAAASARALRRQMLGTTAFVFVAFVLRAAFSTMYAVAFQFRQIGKSIDSCPDICDECHNVYFHITQWMFYTPEFQLMIVLVSSPLALLVALWGMTFESTLQLMNESERSRKLEKEMAPS